MNMAEAESRQAKFCKFLLSCAVAWARSSLLLRLTLIWFPRAAQLGFLSSRYDSTHDTQDRSAFMMPHQTIHSTTAGVYRAAAIIQAQSNPVTQNAIGNLSIVKIAAECYYAKLSRALLSTVSLAGTKVCICVLSLNRGCKFSPPTCLILYRLALWLRLWINQISKIPPPIEDASCHPIMLFVVMFLSPRTHHHPSHQICLEVQSSGDKQNHPPGFHATTPRWRP